MPSMIDPDYEYDLFISYSSKDRDWARKLFTDLAVQGVSVFLDEQRLQGGDIWEAKLLNTLNVSKHLAVLWTEKARGSDWVANEVYTFIRIIHPTGSPTTLDNRTILQIALEGENKALTSYQKISHLEEDGAYKRGINQLNQGVWNQVLEKVERVVLNTDKSTPVLLAVLAMTQPHASKLKLDTKPLGSPPLGEVLKDIGLEDKAIREAVGTWIIEAEAATEGIMPEIKRQAYIDEAKAQGRMTDAEVQLYIDEQMLIRIRAEAKRDDMAKAEKIEQYVQAEAAKHGLTSAQKREQILINKLQQYYGAKPTEWRPFDSSMDIATLMDSVQGMVNTNLLKAGRAQDRFRWQEIGKALWASDDIDEIEREARRLGAELSVIIIDPLSLYDSAVRERLDYLYRSLTNNKALIMVLAPYALPAPMNQIRKVIKGGANRIFNHFFEPEFQAHAPYAKCGADVCDPLDIKRWLLTALRPDAGAPPAARQNAFLNPPGQPPR
jgi:hypothetical protein